ncbi:MAG: murein biosynthesis integral membrane protein MurJ [Propionibacteriaceae bacterium]|nr:murein biosynthesis integral membrane protein MurJ [Propionibacteriaceae bacterium]
MPEGNQRTPQAASGRLMRATAVMASGTLISRVLGFVKGLLLVVVLGSGTALADAYSVATLVPNSLYMILAGGALNTVLVPQIVRHTKSDADGGEAFINRIMTAFLVVLGAVTLLAVPLAGWVIRPWTNAAWLAPDMAAHWTQLVLLAALTMPQLFFFGAFFLIGQVLNARDKFGPMMWAPILNNLVGIAVLGLYLVVWGTSAAEGAPFTDAQVFLLGIGSTLGIIVQTLALVPAMKAIGFRYRPRFDLRGHGLGATFHLAKWMLGYVLLTIIVQAVVSNLATGATGTPGAQPGAGLTAYNTAYLVWILPHSLLTVSLATAMLPSASRLAAAHDLAGVAAETTRTLRLALTFLVPASLGFIALGLPFARLAFGHGANAETWPFIGWTLMAFAVGLIPYTMQYVHLRGFYALEDTRTPFLIQIAISAVNIVIALGLVALDPNPATVAPRLALAYALAYAAGAWLTHRALKRRLPALSGDEVVRHTSQLLLAILPGALIAGVAAAWASGRSFGVVAAVFVGAIALAALSFFFVAKRLGIEESTQLLAVLRRRGATPAEDPSPVGVEEAVEATTERTEQALLAYPDPSEGTVAQQRADTGPHNNPGDVLDGRFRLDQALNRRGSTVTWRAWDLNLSRPVLMHILDPDEPRVLEILDQARQAAQAVDSRYLRVWDATLDETGEHGSYIVCEYAPGQSLELALQQGPLSDVEAAWVVREVAAGLVSMHAQGLYHRQLNPDTVVITASGNVKIVGFLVEHALHPAPATTNPEQADALGLGSLLYASLTGHWPGPAAYGLRSAPLDGKGRPVPAHQARRKISLALSDIADRILSPVPRGRATRLETASDIAVALSTVLGGQDAAHQLESRLRYPIEHVRITAPKARPTDLLASPLAATSMTGAVVAPVPAEDATAAHDPFTDADESESTGPLHSRPDAVPAPPWGNAPRTEAAPDEGVADDDDGTEISTQAFWIEDLAAEDDASPSHPFTPVPPPRSPIRVSPQAASPEPTRRWQGFLFGAFVVVLVVSLAVVFVNQFNRSRALPVKPTTPYALVSARDFDPPADGGDGVENPDQARFVMDGDPSTAWTTERYGRSSNFNGRKPGAGVVVDLGAVRDVSWVTVDVGSGATSAEIRVPADLAVTEVPMGSRDEWRRLEGFTASTGAVEVKLPEAVQTRWLLVYITAMPRDGANYVGSIHEIRVSP